MNTNFIMSKKILITGTAGFVGFHLAKVLLHRGDQVVGLDNVNDYYDVNLKYGRLKETGIEKSQIRYNELVQSSIFPAYRFIQLDLTDKKNIDALFVQEKFDIVVNLAAQAGVRYSLTNPQAYVDSNIQGFLNILEACRHNPVQHLVYASSSSVYGANTAMPFSIHNNVDHPLAMYAVSKKSNELMAHSYSNLFQIPTTGLRFFTVYGPWGRPDMALFIFTKAILAGEPIQVFNHGNMVRDFTYVDDIVEGVVRVIDKPATPNPAWSGDQPDPGTSYAPYRIYNIGNSSPSKLSEFIEAIEDNLGKKAIKQLMPLQEGDVPATFADVKDLENDMGYKPNTTIQEGIKNFVSWYLEFYGK